MLNNTLTGAFGYGMAMSSALNFTVEQNTLVGNTSFIGARGPNCTSTDTTPSPAPFVVDWATVQSSTVQLDFQNITDGDGLTCILPPDGGDYWPFGGNPSPVAGEPGAASATSSGGAAQASGSGSGGLSGGAKAGIAIAVIVGFFALAIAAWFIRKRALKSLEMRRRSAYGQNMGQVHL